MFRLRHVCALLSQTLVPGAILKGGQDTTRARKSPENKCEGFLHGSLSRVGKRTLPIHPDNPHLTTTTRHVMVGITRSKVTIFSASLHREVLTVLANVVGDTWDGQQVNINATGTLQDDGLVGVTLSPYQPQRFRNMTMTMAALLSDSNFETSWIAVDNKVDHVGGMFNSQCSESAFLGARFQICGNHWGWGAQINQVYLEPWTPGERSIFFQIHDKDGQEWSHQTKVHEVKVQFEDGSSPAFWAIPKDPKQRCEFQTVIVEGIPDSEDFRTAGEKAVVALGSSPLAMCTFISRGCPDVTMVGPNQSTVHSFGETLFEGILGTRSAASLVDRFSSGIAPVLRCFRQADPDRNVSWAWGQGSSWQTAAELEDADLWGRVSADVLWIKGIYSGSPVLPLKVEDLVKIVSPNASEVDEGLVRDACKFILSNRDREMKPTIMATLAGAALKTNNPLAVRLVGKECFNYSQISRSEGARKVVSLAWDSAKADSNGLEILNETLRWDANFVKSMLQFAASDQCAGCADVLQELLRVTGGNWSPLVFKSFYLSLGQNSVAFLRINATAPWICVDELEVFSGQVKRIGPLFAFGLQNFLQQLDMCTPPVSELEMPFAELIGLETKLPKTLRLKLDIDGVPMLFQKLPLIFTQLKNLELKLSLDKMDDARTSTFCDEVVKQPSAKLKEMKFAGGKIHAEGMIAISKMVAALPELERLDVSKNHIGDAGFKAFSEAVAPVASKSKLRFINVGNQQRNKLGNLGVQALGKTLALLPALEEVDISYNENITDEGLVGFLSPFLNKSLLSLRKIYMAFTNMSDAGVAVLAELMEKQPLEEISIAYTMITDEGLRLLGHALQNATCLLKKVYASQYRQHKAWSDEGVRDLLQGLKHCPNLVYVDVHGPKLSNQTIQNASEALSGWQNLTKLWVTYGDSGYNLKEKNPLL